MAVLTYTDDFNRADVDKLSDDPTLWTGVIDGKGLSIRSTKLLSTWQDILDGFHNADTSIQTPTSMQGTDEALFTKRQSGSLKFKSAASVSLAATTLPLTFSDDFNRADGALGSNWSIPTGSDAQIKSNAMAIKNPGTAMAYAEWVASPTSMISGFSQCTWTGYTTLTFGGPCVMRETVGINSNLYCLEAYDNGGSEPRAVIKLCRLKTGSTTILATSSALNLSGLALGTPLRLEFDVEPSQVVLRCYVNGVLTITYNDTSSDRLTTGKVGVGIMQFTGSSFNSWDDWSGGELAVAPVSDAAAVSTEMEFFGGAHGVGYFEEEDAPSADTYTRKVYVFTDADYQEATITLLEDDILFGEVEIVDEATCNVVAYVNGVEVLRIDGANRFFGYPAIRGTGNSPEQITYVDGLQARSEQVWSSVTLTAEIMDLIQNETTRTSIATCVRTKDRSAWGKWKFSGTLRAYSVIDNMLVLSIERGDTVFVETVDIGPAPGTRFLDCELLSADMDTPVLDTGVTTWTLPFDMPDDPEHPLVILNLSTGELIPTLDRTFMEQISATGDFVSTNVAIGLLYPTQWELSPIFLTETQSDGSSIALTDGHLQIRHVEINYSGTGEFTVTVIPNTDDESQSYEYTFDGVSDAEKGTFRVPVLGQNTKARITVGGTSHRPFAISNLTWTGYLSQITKRV